MTKILVVDDDQEMTKMLEKYLSNEGYQVTVATTGVAALSAASATEPELVLLDIVLGAEDGREILRDLRSISDVPVIFLTGRGLETERIAGLKLGADDYIVKPFSLGEVSARIETILRRSGVNTAQHAIERPDISFGDLQINENTHEVRLAGQLLDLTSKEFSLLNFIATTPRQVYTRSQLLEHVWASSSEWQNEATVTEHIRRLRAKIEADPDHPKWIKTVRGVGYRFEPQVN
jgi:two-component system phosphate regulon response regulator PhoB